MKTYGGPAQLVLTNDKGEHPCVEMTADLKLATDELARQSLDWQGVLWGYRTNEISLGAVFETWLRIPSVEGDTRCYVEQMHFTRDEIRINLRDDDPKNPLSKRLSLASVVATLLQ